MKCKYLDSGYCIKLSDDAVAQPCIEGPCYLEEPITNADRIRAMSDEEMAEEMKRRAIDSICDIVCGGKCEAIATLSKSSEEVCKDIILAWLRRPAKEDNDG